MLKPTQYLVLLVLGLCSANPLGIAQPATFENNVLSIPQVATLINDEALYYNDIQLAADSEGNFTLLAAQQSTLVSVENVLVSVAESLPVQVSLSVKGNKSVPCVDLQTPAIFRNEFTFTVALAETNLGPAESCIAVLDPFETTIPLDITDLNSGIYTVNVNGVESSFSL